MLQGKVCKIWDYLIHFFLTLAFVGERTKNKMHVEFVHKLRNFYRIEESYGKS
jgi:hypothetical protein